MDAEPKSFLYQCPRCPWSVQAVATTERGLTQPSRGLVAAHIGTHGGKAPKTRTDAVATPYEPSAAALCVECKLYFADSPSKYCQGCAEYRSHTGGY